ncbi:unnamed protein product [Phytophthora lilii]|uniref:Unnamed protein product n=1 Tax=Phytophthora lilii TaxID=2077276 RepID=A0A9W6U6K5_9STRA|nr:unnamed protein product [Phytophthora lilii]
MNQGITCRLRALSESTVTSVEEILAGSVSARTSTSGHKSQITNWPKRAQFSKRAPKRKEMARPKADDKKRARAKPDGPRKRRRRKSSWDYEDNNGDIPSDDASDESDEEPKPKKKRSRPRKVPLPAPPQPKREPADDAHALELKHRARKQQFERDSEQLLQEVRELALKEKKTQQKLIEKLKRDVTTLSRQAEDERKQRQKEVDRIVAEKMREYDAKHRNRDDGDVEKKALKEHIKELESQFASFKRSTGPDDVVTVNAAAASAATDPSSTEPGQQGTVKFLLREVVGCLTITLVLLYFCYQTQLLEIYRLVTSTDIRLIQSTDEDEDGDDCTEIVCTTKDSATGNQFEFELAVPAIASSEIEYLPSEKPPTGIKVPSYLRVQCVVDIYSSMGSAFSTGFSDGTAADVLLVLDSVVDFEIARNCLYSSFESSDS